MAKSLISIKDGNIIDVKTNSSEYRRGCPTCNYGAIYYTEIIIEFIRNGENCTTEKIVSCESGYQMSIGFVQLINFFGRSDIEDMTLEQLVQELDKEFF
jgi:hypothetical protein